MRGIKIDLTGDYPVIDLNSDVSGFDATVQNVMINIGTLAGTDKIFPDKGTDMLSDGVAGRLIDVVSAAHSSNFAAVDTLFFVRKNSVGDSPKLASVHLQTVEIGFQTLKLNTVITSDAGDKAGVSMTTNATM